MFKIELIQTFDGKRHESKKDALRHLDKVYGDKICKIGRDISQLIEYKDRYVKITEFIDENLNLFNELSRIKADMEIEEEEE
jgi:hypothetical protein